MNNVDIKHNSELIGLNDEQYGKYLNQLIELSKNPDSTTIDELNKISMLLHINSHSTIDIEQNATILQMPLELYSEFLQDFITQSKENKKNLSTIKDMANNLLLEPFVDLIEQIESSDNKEEKKAIRKQYLKLLKELNVENN